MSNVKKMKKPQTNVELVTEIMEFSNFGAMSQVFVIDALTKHCERVSKSKVGDYPENSFIHPESWIGVANEIKEKLNNRG